MNKHINRIGIAVLSIAVLMTVASWLAKSWDYKKGNRAAISLWKGHEKVMEDVVNGGGDGSLQEFMDSALFFSELTGIDARVDGSYVGLHPTEHTKDDLELWRIWFKENRSRIFWNHEAQMVELKPE